VDVPEAASSDIRTGMPATAVARELPGQKFVGTVARTSRSIDSSSRTMRVEVDLKNPDLALLPGMYMNVEFKVAQPQPTIRIPASALTFRTGGPEVAVVDGDGTLRFHSVSIGRDLGDSIEIASGVTAGERVALNVGNQTADGDHVTANELNDLKDGSTPAGVNRTAVVAVKTDK